MACFVGAHSSTCNILVSAALICLRLENLSFRNTLFVVFFSIKYIDLYSEMSFRKPEGAVHTAKIFR